MGTGVDRDYYIDRRLYSFSRVFGWRDGIIVGLFLAGFGVYAGLFADWAPGAEGRALPFMAFFVSAGAVSIVWGLRLLSHDRAVTGAMDREFPAED